MEGILFQTSLVAAFVAGVVALFAPCCITFLLPAYLGNVFKEKEKVLGMTFVFGLGIYAMLLPAVIGVTAISRFVFDYHNTIYYIGGIVMLSAGLITLLGLKLPMPHLPGRDPQKTDVFSVFTTGIFSGITSACCAPVLIGVLALTFLSPNFFGALLIGSFYVLGMVLPLLFISIFLDGKMPGIKIFKKKVGEIKVGENKYVIISSNLIAAIIFMFTGILILILTPLGKLQMSETEYFTDIVKDSGNFVSKYTSGGIINVVFGVCVFILLLYISKKLKK